MLDDYIESHIDPEPAHLAALYRHTNLTRLYPRMCSGHIQGRLLVMLTHMIAPRRVLELGTFTGYSALCFAEALGADGRVDTVELDDEYADELREFFASSPGGEKITLHIGDAEEFLAQAAPGSYDMVFIDANKRRYPEYYEASLRVVRPGGYILADNTLWSDKVGQTDPSGSPEASCSKAHKDPQTAGIEAFNDLVARDPRVQTAILPVRDGLTILRKL